MEDTVIEEVKVKVDYKERPDTLSKQLTLYNHIHQFWADLWSKA